jgi:hypothetical protein
LRSKERKAASVERSSSLHHSPKVGHAGLRYPNKSAGRKFREAGKHKIYNTWLLLACWLACFLSLITKFPSTIELPQKRDQVSCLHHHHHFLLLLLIVLPIGSIFCIYELPLHLFFYEDARAESGKVERERERERERGREGGREESSCTFWLEFSLKTEFCFRSW